MPRFRATVRVTELEGPDPASVQKMLDERLKEAGFARWRVTTIETEGVAHRPRGRDSRAARRRSRSEGWGLFLIAAGAWAVWFFYLLVK